MGIGTPQPMGNASTARQDWTCSCTHLSLQSTYLHQPPVYNVCLPPPQLCLCPPRVRISAFERARPRIQQLLHRPQECHSSTIHHTDDPSEEEVAAKDHPPPTGPQHLPRLADRVDRRGPGRGRLCDDEGGRRH